MRKLALLLVISVVAVASVAVSVAGAGNGVKKVQFTAAYGGFTCKGQRIVTTGKHASSMRDRETCDVVGPDTTTLAKGKYTIVAAGADPATTRWISDYEFFVNPGNFIIQAVSGTVNVKNRPDGTQVWQIRATYY